MPHVVQLLPHAVAVLCDGLQLSFQPSDPPFAPGLLLEQCAVPFLGPLGALLDFGLQCRGTGLQSLPNRMQAAARSSPAAHCTASTRVSSVEGAAASLRGHSWA